jgi:hypothetical protein
VNTPRQLMLALQREAGTTGEGGSTAALRGLMLDLGMDALI